MVDYASQIQVEETERRVVVVVRARNSAADEGARWGLR